MSVPFDDLTPAATPISSGRGMDAQESELEGGVNEASEGTPTEFGGSEDKVQEASVTPETNTKELDEGKGQLEKLEESKKEGEERLVKVEGKTAALETQIKKLDEVLQERLGGLVKFHGDTLEFQETTNTRLDDVEAANAALATKNEVLEGRVEELERENGELETKLEALMETKVGPGSKFEARLSKLEEGGNEPSDAVLARIDQLEEQLVVIKDKQDAIKVAHNVIIFGSSGTGKSSIVNLLVGDDVAPTGNGAKGCTFQSERYEAELGGVKFALYDTAGLDEDDIGRIPASKALAQLYDLIINQLEGKGVSLLVFCVRAGRISKAVGHNWKLFVDIVCQNKVPVCLAITGLADHGGTGETPKEVMQSWWKDGENQEVFKRLGVDTKWVACITAKQGKLIKALEKGEEVYQFGAEYAASKDILADVMLTSYSTIPWTPKPVQWLETTTKKMRESRCWPFWSGERSQEVEVPGDAFKKLQLLYNCGEAEAWKIVHRLTGRASVAEAGM